jgi:hypothetical protein
MKNLWTEDTIINRKDECEQFVVCKGDSSRKSAVRFCKSKIWKIPAVGSRPTVQFGLDYPKGLLFAVIHERPAIRGNWYGDGVDVERVVNVSIDE